MAILERINSFFNPKGYKVTLAELIEGGVISFLETKSRDKALEQLVEALADAGELADKKDFLKALLAREEIASTGIGMGVAIPHAKLPTLSRFFLAIGLQKGGEGVEWGAPDDVPIQLIFMIGGPANQQTEYLKILSHLTFAIKDEERRKSLMNAKTKEEVIKLFEGC